MRKVLVFILVLLQLAAPLVHAHVGKGTMEEGMHLPGLEFISQDNEAPSFEAVSVLGETTGIIVSIGSGIELKNFSFDTSADDCIPQVWRISGERIFSKIVDSPAYLTQYIPFNISRPGIPRAPPVLI